MRTIRKFDKEVSVLKWLKFLKRAHVPKISKKLKQFSEKMLAKLSPQL